jgi:hypothetical protein
MLIEINEGGQYASIDPAYVVWAKVHERSGGGWAAVVRCSTGSSMCSSLSSEFGPFEDKADADAIVRRVTEAANKAQSVICNPDVVELQVEHTSEFVEFVNHNLCRVAVRRDSMCAVEIAPPTEHGSWEVMVRTGGVWFHSQSFDTSSAADELFDRLTR